MSLRKSVFGTVSVLGLAGMLSFNACSSDSDRSEDGHATEGRRASGGIGLELRLADGSDVDVVNFTVTRNGQSVRTGTLAIGPDGLATGQINGLDAGDNYQVQLSAPRTRPDAGAVAPCTGASALFAVVANQTVPVSVVLQCDDTSPDQGNITINGSFNVCPKITSASATPSSTTVGSTISLTATATDKDAADVVAFAWYTGTYSTGSTFATTASATYTCTAPGTVTIGLRAFDGPSRGCEKFLTPAFTITCTGSVPEQDAGAPQQDASAPQQDASAPQQDASAPEQDASAPQQDASAPQQDASTPPAARFGTAECGTCMAQFCNPFFDGVNYVDDCTDATCEAAFACFQRNRCAQGVATVTNCYCGGGVTFETCQVDTYDAVGPCADLVETGLGTTVRREVFEQFFNPNTSTGDGLALFNCAAELCVPECLTSSSIPAP